MEGGAITRDRWRTPSRKANSKGKKGAGRGQEAFEKEGIKPGMR